MRLILHYEGGQYELLIGNDPAAIGLKLGPQGDEAMAVKNLASAMKDGSEQVIEDAEYIFDNFEQVTPEFMTDVFGTTTDLMLEGEVLFSAPEAETLLSTIVEAGEALAAAFV